MDASMGADGAIAAARPCIGIEIPPGPEGIDALMPPLAAALAASGPAIALLPGTGSASYRDRIRAAVRPGEPVPAEVAVVASTSGSTGSPAGVLLPGAALRAAAHGFAARVGQPDGHRWVAALPLHHAGGLMVAVRSAVTGTTPVGLPSLGGAEPFSIDGFAAATGRAVELSMTDDRPLAVSLVPPMLALLDAAGAAGWDLLAEFDVVLVGGASTPKALVDRLLFAGVHLFTSYGMTETCGGVAFDGRALDGARVQADADGRLAVSGPQVALGYRDGRDRHRWSVDSDGVRRFQTDDVGRVGADGIVVVGGRADDVVQVAGTSVSVGAVRAVLESDPRVAAAEVVALPDERFGATVAAVVVPGTSAPEARELADLVAARLGRAARPRVVRLVREIPLLESGKPDRGAIADLARSSPP